MNNFGMMKRSLSGSCRHFNTRYFSSSPIELGIKAAPMSQFGGVHGAKAGLPKMWRNKPLFKREGDRIFKTGSEAIGMLNIEASRRDTGATEFLESWEGMVQSLGAVFDRQPKYAWIMKQMLEPERTITFR